MSYKYPVSLTFGRRKGQILSGDVAVGSQSAEEAKCHG